MRFYQLSTKRAVIRVQNDSSPSISNCIFVCYTSKQSQRKWIKRLVATVKSNKENSRRGVQRQLLNRGLIYNSVV